MLPQKAIPKRFMGLDLHKHYLLATAVDADLQKVYGPKRVALVDLDNWMRKELTHDDAVVLEMTTNTWQVYDELLPYAHSVTVVHPPHVSLIVRAQVMTDKIAAFQLARLHAKGLLTGIWVPPQEVRDLRTLVAQRQKMTSLKTQAKNRLQSVLHRYHILPPEGKLFDPEMHSWWLELPVNPLERVRIQSDLDTLAFAQGQISHLEGCMAVWAVRE
jgi:transposase